MILVEKSGLLPGAALGLRTRHMRDEQGTLASICCVTYVQPSSSEPLARSTIRIDLPVWVPRCSTLLARAPGRQEVCENRLTCSPKDLDFAGVALRCCTKFRRQGVPATPGKAPRRASETFWQFSPIVGQGTGMARPGKSLSTILC